MLLKYNPRLLPSAMARLNNCKQIGIDLDLGNGRTVVAFETLIDRYSAKLNEYNGVKADHDSIATELRDLGQLVQDEREAMLEAVGLKFGKNSPEYAKAGGVRKKERRRPLRPASTPSIVNP
jgi:hypothetical protein